MRYQLFGGGQPVGPWLIPHGTIIDTDQLADGWSKLINERGIVPPITAQALDQATYDWMCKQYGVEKVGVWPIPTA
jgi:hypothetical protein